jgi:hypothetical protein
MAPAFGATQHLSPLSDTTPAAALPVHPPHRPFTRRKLAVHPATLHLKGPAPAAAPRRRTLALSHPRPFASRTLRVRIA